MCIEFNTITRAPYTSMVRQCPQSVDLEESGGAEVQYEYCRPALLGTLSPHAREAMAATGQRLTVCPTRPASLPRSAGYAEVVNAGKSRENEDQAVKQTLQEAYKTFIFIFASPQHDLM